MATTDSNGIVFLQDTDIISPFHTLMNTLQQGTSDAITGFKNGTNMNLTVHYVANTTARASLATSYGPTTSKPLIVWRTDAGDGREMEYTTNGSTWTVISNKPPMAKITKTAAQTTTTGGTNTTILFDTEEYDTNTLHSTATNTGRITIPTGWGGYWRFNAKLGLSATATYLIALYAKNGVAQTATTNIATTTTGNVRVTCDATFSLAAGDYIELLSTASAGGVAYNVSECWMEAQFIRFP